jgi:hypothetical protein
MRLIRFVPLIVIGVTWLASCAHLPESTRSDQRMAGIREEYLRGHPDGKFNVFISEGRVVKGMGIFEVLASWGLPNARRSSDDGNTEYWAYYAKDEPTQKIVSYELVFQDKVLTHWVVHAELPTGLGSGQTSSVDVRTIEETLQLGPGRVGDSSTPKKRP